MFLHFLVAPSRIPVTEVAHHQWQADLASSLIRADVGSGTDVAEPPPRRTDGSSKWLGSFTRRVP